MTGKGKWLLLLEVFVCFCPISLFLLMGVAMSWFQIMLLTSGMPPGEPVWGSYLVIFSTVGGLLGLLALTIVLIKIFRPNASVVSHKLTLFFIFLAVLPLTLMAIEDSGIWRLIAIAPLVSTVHIMYLGRSYLFPQRARFFSN